MLSAHILKWGLSAFAWMLSSPKELRLREPEPFSETPRASLIGKQMDLCLWSQRDSLISMPLAPTCLFFYARVLLVLSCICYLGHLPFPTATRASSAEAMPKVMKPIFRLYQKPTFKHNPSQPEYLILTNAFLDRSSVHLFWAHWVPFFIRKNACPTEHSVTVKWFYFHNA